MQLVIRFLLLFVLLGACQEAPSNKSAQSIKKLDNNNTPQKKATTNGVYDISTAQTANGWGYQIRQNGKLLLDQPTVPGRPGVAGFQTQEDAQKVAELVKSKLQAKIFPPTVSEDELMNLNIH